MRHNVEMALLRTERGLDRIVNFTDAATAISLTLLVLPLVDIGNEINQKHTLEQVLPHHWENLLAFAISFAVIGNLWLVHHRIFEFVRDYDGWLAILNLVWLFMITCLPFSTNVVANGGQSSAIYALYLGNVFLASAASLSLRLYLSKHRHLLRPEVADQLHVLAMLVPSAIILVCTVLAILVPSIGAAWLFLLFAGNPIERAIIARQKKATAAH